MNTVFKMVMFFALILVVSTVVFMIIKKGFGLLGLIKK